MIEERAGSVKNRNAVSCQKRCVTLVFNLIVSVVCSFIVPICKHFVVSGSSLHCLVTTALLFIDQCIPFYKHMSLRIQTVRWPNGLRSAIILTKACNCEKISITIVPRLRHADIHSYQFCRRYVVLVLRRAH